MDWNINNKYVSINDLPAGRPLLGLAFKLAEAVAAGTIPASSVSTGFSA